MTAPALAPAASEPRKAARWLIWPDHTGTDSCSNWATRQGDRRRLLVLAFDRRGVDHHVSRGRKLGSARIVAAPIRAATMVVIPVRPGFFDLAAVRETVATARELNKPYGGVRFGESCAPRRTAKTPTPANHLGLGPTQGRSLRWGRDRPARQLYVRSRVCVRATHGRAAGQSAISLASATARIPSAHPGHRGRWQEPTQSPCTSAVSPRLLACPACARRSGTPEQSSAAAVFLPSSKARLVWNGAAWGTDTWLPNSAAMLPRVIRGERVKCWITVGGHNTGVTSGEATEGRWL
jgi:hypothetical protein